MLMVCQRIQVCLTYIMKLVIYLEDFLIILILFYKVRLSKKHMVAFWSDNIKGMQQLTGTQLNLKLIKIKRVFILRCLILSISFRTKHMLRICGKVVHTLSVLASVFQLLKIATNVANNT